MIIEDTPKIQCAAPNCLIMQTSEHFDTRRALRVAMRRRPDRIIVGKVRGGELVEQEHHGQFGLRLVVGDASERDADAAARKARIWLIRRAPARAVKTIASAGKTQSRAAWLLRFVLAKGKFTLTEAAPIHRVTKPPS